MSAPLLWATTLIYAFVAVDLWLKGNHGMAMAFFGYCIANCGIIWSL